MKSSARIKLLVCLFSFSFLISSQAVAQGQPARVPLTLKISHQYPPGADYRHRICQLFSKQVEERTKGALKFEIYPDSTLFKPVPQYDAMVKGTLDISVFPLDYAADKVPQYSITKGKVERPFWFLETNLLNARTLRRQSAIVPVTVHMRELGMDQIERYLRAERPYDCAGSARIEGLGIALVARLESDDPTALIGLPLIRLCDMLKSEGVELP